MLSRTNGGCYIKPLCSHAYFFSRNRRPYRGVNLPGFLGETRKRILNIYIIIQCVYIYILYSIVYIYILIYYQTSYIGQCLTHTVYAPWTVSIYRFTQYAAVIAMWINLWLSEGKWEFSHTCATNIKYTN
jgi:hypothetical protein